MKKVLLVTHVSGFVPQFEMNNVKILQQMGYEVHYASNYNNPQYGNDNSRLNGTGIICHQVDFARSPFRIFQNIRAYRQLRRLLKKEDFDLLHCHTPVGGAIARLAAKKNKKMKVIYTVHGFHFFKGAPLKNWIIYYPIEKFLAHYTDVLITINEEDYKVAQKFKLKNHGKVRKINGVGIDSQRFLEIYIDRWLEQHSGSVFVSVGELNVNKNHRLVIEALHKISRRDFYYYICGEGTEFENLKKLTIRYGLEKQVLFLGYQKDIRDILKKADIFIMPSYREGLSVALQEAMASGLPIIASNIRGNSELVSEGEGGWLIPSDNVNMLAQVMETACSSQLHSMGKYNIDKIKKYDKNEVAKSMKEIYNELLEEDIC